MVQEIKKPLKINNQSLADGTYRSRHDCQSNLPPPPPSYPPQQPPPYHPSTNFSQPPLLYALTIINESASCVGHRLQCNQKTSDTTQQHQIFYSRCSIKNNICNLIIDNGSHENIVSSALVDYLKLEMEPHPHPYTCLLYTSPSPRDS